MKNIYFVFLLLAMMCLILDLKLFNGIVFGCITNLNIPVLLLFASILIICILFKRRLLQKDLQGERIIKYSSSQSFLNEYGCLIYLLMFSLAEMILSKHIYIFYFMLICFEFCIYLMFIKYFCRKYNPVIFSIDKDFVRYKGVFRIINRKLFEMKKLKLNGFWERIEFQLEEGLNNFHLYYNDFNAEELKRFFDFIIEYKNENTVIENPLMKYLNTSTTIKKGTIA